MYKMLIVDDEHIILEGIKTAVEWKKIGIELVGTASNAVVAFEKYKSLKSDIILSDIKMPEHTGLDLLEWIKAENQETEVVFLSAYSDFEYTRKGIQLGAYDYLLKTNIFTELECVMKRLKDYLDSKRSREREYRNSMNAKNQFLFFEFLRGEENINIVDVKKKYYGMVTLWQNAIQGNEKVFLNQYRSAVPYVMGKQGEITCYIFWGNEKNILMDTMESLLSEIEVNFQQQRGNHLSLQYTLIENIQEISIMFRHAMKLIDVAQYTGDYSKKYIFNHKKTGLESIDYYDKAKTIIAQIRRYKCRKGQRDISDLFKEIYEDVGVNYIDVFQIFQFFVMEVLNTIEDLDDGFKVYGKEVVKRLSKNISIIEMEKEVQGFIGKLEAMVSKLDQSDIGLRINEAKRYIDEHYSEQIKMSFIAEMFFLSPAYFSVQFKRLIGKSFSEYLTDIRLNIAYDLLINSKDKVYEIARKVGYQDERHFSKQFKGQYGVTPKALQKKYK